LWSLHAQQADWDHAASQLAAVGWARPGLVAAWLELEPERIEAALGHPGTAPPDPSEWDIQRVAIADAPAYILRQRAADPGVLAARQALQRGPLPSGEEAQVTWSAGQQAGQQVTCPAALVRHLHSPGIPSEDVIDDAQALGFEDVALELALVRASHKQRVRPDRIVAWLAARGRTPEAIRWCQTWMDSAQQQETTNALLPALGWAGDLHLGNGQSERAQQYFEDGKTLAEQLGDDLQTSRFAARLGDIHRVTGETQRAKVSHERSLTTRQRLLAADPENLNLLYAVSEAHARVGDMCDALGDLDAASQHYRSSLALQSRLAAEQPNKQIWYDSTLVSRDRIAAMHAKLGQRELVIDLYQSILSDQQRQIELDPSNLDRQANLATSSDSLGTLHFRARQFGLAKTYYDQALDLQSALVSAEPSRVSWLEQLSTTYNKLGDVYLATGDAANARVSYERALTMREDLVDREPRRTDFAHKLALSYARLGDVHLAIGGVDQAREFFELGIGTTEQLVARDPNDYELKRSLSGSYQRMAIVDDTNALTWLDKAIAMSRACVARAPNDLDARHELGLYLSQLGVLLRSRGDEAGAEAAAVEATARLGTTDPRVALGGNLLDLDSLSSDS
jgi:tetratricopeptide (TPR) repeat protein